MDSQILIDAFEQYGYVALVLVFWVTIVWTPIPNEAVVMSGGYISTLGILHPIPAFIATYFGITTAYTTGYFAGRIIGSPAMEYLAKKRSWERYINRAQGLIKRYGAISLVISYLAPIVQIIFPLIVGINKMSFTKFALFSYTAGFIWTLFYFLIGRYFGNTFDISNQMLIEYSWIAAVVVIVIMLFGKRRKRNFKKSELTKDEIG